MCYDCSRRDVKDDAERLGIEVQYSLAESPEVYFKSQEDLNFYRAVGSVKEKDQSLKFLVKQKPRTRGISGVFN